MPDQPRITSMRLAQETPQCEPPAGVANGDGLAALLVEATSVDGFRFDLGTIWLAK